MDCVTHDVHKFLTLLTRKNGYVLEQLFSPLVVHDSGCLDELRSLARGALTRHVVHHYKGFFRRQERSITANEAPTVKAVLYLFRVVLTGLHLLRTREVETDILELNDRVFHLPFIEALVEQKMTSTETSPVTGVDLEELLDEARHLEAQLDPAAEASGLPEHPGNMEALNDFLVRLRLDG